MCVYIKSSNREKNCESVVAPSMVMEGHSQCVQIEAYEHNRTCNRIPIQRFATVPHIQLCVHNMLDSWMSTLSSMILRARLHPIASIECQLWCMNIFRWAHRVNSFCATLLLGFSADTRNLWMSNTSTKNVEKSLNMFVCLFVWLCAFACGAMASSTV